MKIGKKLSHEAGNIIIAENFPGIARLTGRWHSRDQGHVKLDYSSVRRNVLKNSGSTSLVSDGENCWYFDGVNDYLTEETISEKQSTCYGSMIDGNAFFIDEGQDFTSYEKINNARYVIDVWDAYGYHAGGFLGATGTGYTYGSDIVSNGDFSSWTVPGNYDNNPDSWTVASEVDINRRVSENSGAAQIYSTSGYVSLRWLTSILEGKLYKIQFDIPERNSGSVKIEDGYTGITAYSTPGSYTKLLTTISSTPFVGFKRESVTCDLSIDNVVIQEILTAPATTGINIYSNIECTSQNWAYMHPDFESNRIYGYKIHRVDLHKDQDKTIVILFQGDGSGYLLTTNNPFLNQGGFGIYYYHTNNGITFYYSNYDAFHSIEVSNFLDPDKFSVLTVKINDSESKLAVYCNGEKVADADLEIGIGKSFAGIEIGRRPSASYFNGKIKQIFVYNSLLNDLEIENISQQLLRKN